MSAAIEPPVTDAAYAPCAEVLLPLVERTWRRLDKAISGLTLEGESVPLAPGQDQGEAGALRRRVGVRRLRPRHGSIRRPPRRGHGLLGHHQDAHVAQTIIRELASHDGTDGLTGMSLGLLYEFESEEEILDRLRFVEMWPRARRSARRAGMR